MREGSSGLFHSMLQDFLLIVAYYPETLSVTSKNAAVTIKAMQVTVSRHNIAVTNNMPFSSSEFRKFSKQWIFTLLATSPNYPQSNSLIEHNVQTIKRLYKV